MYGRRAREICLKVQVQKITSILSTAILDPHGTNHLSLPTRKTTILLVTLDHHATNHLRPTELQHKEPRDVSGARKELGRILMQFRDSD
jgi:hypothetical protein